MLTLEWVLLVVGALMFISAAAAVGIRRRRYLDELANVNEGLIPRDLHHELPEGVSAGMVGSLLDDAVDYGDVMIGLLELAAMGHVKVRPLVDEDTPQSTPYDWVVKLDEPAPETLLDYQRTLLTIPFGSGRKASTSTRPAVALSGMIMDSHRPFATSKTQLRRASSERGFLPLEGGAEFRNMWGCAGGAVLLLGLIGTVVMIIGGLATASLAGVLGAMLIAVSGAMIASLGPLSVQKTPEGTALREDTLSHRDFLKKLDASQVQLETAADDFSRWLPAAVAFNHATHLGKVFDQVVERAGKWGRPLDVTPDWLTLSDVFDDDVTPKPSQIVDAVNAFIRDGAQLAHAEGRRH